MLRIYLRFFVAAQAILVVTNAFLLQQCSTSNNYHHHQQQKYQQQQQHRMSNLPSPEESAAALTDFMAKAHEEKLRAMKQTENQFKARIEVCIRTVFFISLHQLHLKK